MIEIKIYGETGDDTIAELRKLAAALSGGTDPQPAAAVSARKARDPKPAEASAPAPAETVIEQPGSAAVPSSVGPTVTTTPDVSTSPVTETQAPVVPVTEADITAAANAAAAKLGASGPAKIKAHITGKFTKPDGTPGTLKTTRPEQHAMLLDDLQKIGRGELTLA